MRLFWRVELCKSSRSVGMRFFEIVTPSCVTNEVSFKTEVKYGSTVFRVCPGFWTLPSCSLHLQILWYISGQHPQIVHGASVCCVWQKKFSFIYPYRCHFSCISAIFCEYDWILKNLSIFLDKISYSSLKKFWNLRMWFTNVFAYCCPDLNTTSKTLIILWNQIFFRMEHLKL